MYAFTYCAGISRTSWPTSRRRRLHKKSIFCTKSPPLVELYVQSPERPNLGSAGRSQPCGPRPCTHKSGWLGSGAFNVRYAPECMDPPCVARENGEPGVRSCTNVSGLALELVLRTIMEIRAHPILLAAMPLRAISGVSSRMRREDQFSISSLSLADLGGETIAGSHAVSGNHRHCAAGFIDLTSKQRPP